VKDVAPGFAVMGRCEDGIIEAIWNPNKRFLWAVQWHPEEIWKIEDSSAALFRALISACQ
jgi:putative glutamine amidotransferase